MARPESLLDRIKWNLRVEWHAVSTLWMLLTIGATACSVIVFAVLLIFRIDRLLPVGVFVLGPLSMAGSVGIVLHRKKLSRRLVDEEFMVCPGCLYSLQGQQSSDKDIPVDEREMRCPECGRRWTLGDLRDFWNWFQSPTI